MSVFHFKNFTVSQANSSMKVGTDSMLLGALVEAIDPQKILDIGAGTGVLSLMMAQKFPAATIIGVEVDQDAMKDCNSNFENSIWNDRLTMHCGDFLNYGSNEKFDLIISNPPFFENSLKSSMEGRNLARHNDSLPLDALAQKVSELLSDEGLFWVILPIDSADKLIVCSRYKGLFPARIIEIEGKPGKFTRRIIQFTSKEIEHITQELVTVRNEQGKYTEQYKRLTLEFHDRLI